MVGHTGGGGGAGANVAIRMYRLGSHWNRRLRRFGKDIVLLGCGCRCIGSRHAFIDFSYRHLEYVYIYICV